MTPVSIPLPPVAPMSFTTVAMVPPTHPAPYVIGGVGWAPSAAPLAAASQIFQTSGTGQALSRAGQPQSMIAGTPGRAAPEPVGIEIV